MTTSARDVDQTLATPRTADVEQHSLGRSLALHLLPGALTAAAFYALAPGVMHAGYPAIAAAVLAAGTVLVGAELG